MASCLSSKQALRNRLLAFSLSEKLRGYPGGGDEPLFAFKLHQFISRRMLIIEKGTVGQAWRHRPRPHIRNAGVVSLLVLLDDALAARGLQIVAELVGIACISERPTIAR
jgi:hypothetical protein